MSKNIKKIRAGIRDLLPANIEIMSAVVISVNESDLTMEARTSSFEDTDAETVTVSLNAVSENNNGCILYPEVGSNVIIASVDGPGEYILVRASNITKASITIDSQVFTMDGTKYGLVNGSESLGKIMDDLLQAILNLTVSTSTGPSGTPINSSTISNIKSRLDNFLTI